MIDVKKLFSHTKGMYIVAAIAVVLAIGLLISFSVFGKGSGPGEMATQDYQTTKDTTQPTAACKYARLLDGVCVDNVSAQDPSLIGVMIENHYDARPVSGLSRASVVYEAPVEGNFNRFFALFPVDTDIQKVGPVRSARPYYLDWLSEYPGTMYMHVGGSPDALAKLEQYGLFDMNEFYRGWYFWRDNKRYAPHNAYTSQKLWSSALEDYGDTVDPVDSHVSRAWKFQEWDACEENCVNEITTTYAGRTYEATWQYNTSTEQYERFEFDEPVIDPETKEQLVVDTLIVQYVDTTVLDGVGRLGMDTIGSGDAIIFRNGFKVEGEWRKDSRTGRTLFYDFDEEGQEIPLQAGKIWIAVMNQTGDVSYE